MIVNVSDMLFHKPERAYSERTGLPRLWAFGGRTARGGEHERG